MNKITFLFILYTGVTLPISAHGQDDQIPGNSPVNSQTRATSERGPEDETVAESPAEEAKAVDATVDEVKVIQENTVTQCGDKKDNDNDGHVDCADQDCTIFAICVDHDPQGTPAPTKASTIETNRPSDSAPSEPPITRPFSIGFVPGLSTDSAADGAVLNHFSLNLIGWQDHLRGAEFSILGAIRKGNVVGFQGSHLFNVVAGDLGGFQGAGLVNVTGGATNGLQAAGLVNMTGDGGKGVQMSGIANVAGGEFTGLQLSLVNVGTHVTGAQVGLVNIASKSMKGASIGLINFAGDGMFAPTVWMSPASMFNMGLKMGTKNFYSLIGAGVHPLGDERRTAVAFGLGTHGNLSKRWWLEFDLMHNRLYDQNFSFNSYDDYDVDFIEQARLNLGVRVARDFSVYAGPTLDVLVSEVRDEIGFSTFYTHTDKSADTNVAISMGLTAGIQWEPKIGHLNTRD